MKILFIHQNTPGQYKHLAAALARDPANSVVFIGQRNDRAIPGARLLTYAPKRKAAAPTHPYLLSSENAVLHGQEVARVILALKRDGFVPDIVVGHPGWGETLYVKDALPGVPVLSYCEYYYRGTGADVGFDPLHAAELNTLLSVRTRAMPLLSALEACDRGVAPTEWQRSTHPLVFQPKIATIHDGVDTRALRPDPAASLTLPDGRVLTAADEVVTYAARNLEPYRGFPSFMKAVPRICAARPDATVLVIGGDAVSYGSAPKGGGTWREVMLKEVEVDPARVVFLGHLPYERYRNALALSRAHVYLTYPFVLSWSMLEAMAMERVIIGSDTAPVTEVIEDGTNGLLVDFFSPAAIADRVVDVLRDPGAFAHLGRAARETVAARYDLTDCLRRHMALVRETAGRP